MRVWTGSILLVMICSHWANAQIVQLPSFHQFSYTGTVEVPVGGTMSLGGNHASASSQVRRSGLFAGPIARSASTRHGVVSVSATIIDHQEIDKVILGETPAQIIARHHEVNARRDRESRGTQLVDRNEEGKALVRHARLLYQQGRHSAARDAYDLALEGLRPDLRDLAIAEMRRCGLR